MSLPKILVGSGGVRRVMGLLGLLVLGQVFLYLGVEQASPLLPGNWSAYVPIFQFYLLTTFVALFFLWVPAKGGASVLDTSGEFSIVSFLRNYAWVFAMVWGLAFVIFVVLLGEKFVLSPETSRLQGFVYVLAFVAPTEELLFRVALPKHFAWPLSAGVAFALYHLWAYSLQVPNGDIQALVSQLVWAGILGVVFYALYTKWGYGAAVGAHAAYDLLVLGVISFGILGTGLFIV